MMKVRAKVRTIAIGCSLLAAGFLVDGGLHIGIVVSEAQARIGRPATPGSVAGVARRTTRRRIRRTTIYVATLPRGCTTVNIDGTVLSQCGGTYYQPYNGQYVVVNVE
jgi:hypothetical protein